MDYVQFAWLIGVIVAFLIGVFKVDPNKKYRETAISILTHIKEITPDNVDEIIDLFIKGLKNAGLNPESKIAKDEIAEIRREAGFVTRKKPKT